MENDLIIDVGLHHGQDSEFYLKKGFRVVAIEANPQCAEIAARRLAPYVESGQLIIENVGIAETKGELPFYVNDTRDEWSSFIPHTGQRQGKFHEIIVPTVPFQEILSKYGVPYYLKIDIEGFDSLVIKALWSTRDRPAYVSYECVPNNLDGLAHLRCLGYSHFKMIDQRLNPPHVLPSPPREGPYVEHTFELGSSGAFGEETLGEWSTFAEVIDDYVAFWKFRRDDRRKPKTWCDFHAKHASRVRLR